MTITIIASRNLIKVTVEQIILPENFIFPTLGIANSSDNIEIF